MHYTSIVTTIGLSFILSQPALAMKKSQEKLNSDLLKAIELDNRTKIITLITAGAGINHQYSGACNTNNYTHYFEETPLTVASLRCNNASIVKILLDHHADINCKNKWGDHFNEIIFW